MKDGNPGKTSCQEEHCSLEVKQNVIENDKSIVVKSDVRGLKRIADENIFVNNFDRKNENVDLSYEHDQTPVIAKLDPKPDRKRDAENRKKEDDGGRIGRKKMMVGGKEEEENVFATLKPKVKPQQKIENLNTKELRNITMKRCTITEPRFTAKPDLYKMHGQGGSPIRGGRVMKPKSGTPSKLNFKKKIQLFENQASQGLTSGYIELLVQSRLGHNPANLTAGGGGGGTVLNSDICVDQPEGGTQTRPRGTYGPDFSTGPGLVERCQGGLPPPMRCAGTDLCTNVLC